METEKKKLSSEVPQKIENGILPSLAAPEFVILQLPLQPVATMP